MADPITGLAAVSAVVNVIQLLEFSGKVAQQTHKILTSTTGTLEDIKSMEVLVSEYRQLGADMCQQGIQSSPLNMRDAELVGLASRCKGEAEDLLKRLQDMKLDDGARGVQRTWDGARKATKALTSKRDLRQKQERLSELNNQLSTRLLTIVRSEMFDMNSSFLQRLNSTHDHTLNAILESKQAILDDLRRRQQQDVQDNEKAKIILRSLSFEEMALRHASIPEAYVKTYEWVLEEHSLSSDWLRRGHGLFWVNGKAGSGKSTLMKFLAAHRQTRDALDEWCGSQQLVMADFYFWYLGSNMQKSIKGLLQSIIYRILSRRPDLAPFLCPRRWDASGPLELQAPWTEAELYRAIELAAQTVGTVSLCK